MELDEATVLDHSPPRFYHHHAVPNLHNCDHANLHGLAVITSEEESTLGFNWLDARTEQISVLDGNFSAKPN